MLTDSQQPISGFEPAFRFLGSGELFGVPVPIIIFAASVLIAAAVLRQTTLGRYTYAVGGNEEAVKLSGVSVDFYKTSAYTICGATAALGAVVLTSRLNAAEPIAGDGYELDVIAADPAETGRLPVLAAKWGSWARGLKFQGFRCFLPSLIFASPGRCTQPVKLPRVHSCWAVTQVSQEPPEFA